MSKQPLQTLRDILLSTTNKLIDKQITVQKAAVIVKAAEVFCLTYRRELEQARLNGVSPDIKFIDND